MHIILIFLGLMLIMAFWRLAAKTLAVIVVCVVILVAGGAALLHAGDEDHAQHCAMNPRPYGLICP